MLARSSWREWVDVGAVLVLTRDVLLGCGVLLFEGRCGQLVDG